MTFTYESKYNIYSDCQFMVGYYQNGNIGVEVWSEKEGPVTKVTTNPDIPIGNDMIAIKNYSENEGMVDWLKSMEIIEPDPVRVVISGWVEIPIHKLTTKGLRMMGLYNIQ